MIPYIFKRLLSLLISLCLASIVIFTVVEVAPGDPAAFMLGINAQDDTILALRKELLISGTIAAFSQARLNFLRPMSKCSVSFIIIEGIISRVV